jgi:hypothetical protein
MSLENPKFLVISRKTPNFDPFLSNILLANRFIFLIPRSYNGKETDNVSMQ